MAKEQIGMYGSSRESKAGKGSYISSTHGEGWLKNVEDRLSAREFPCSKCGVVRKAGKCPDPCGYESEFAGW